MEVDAEFERQGGSELACMSTTTDLAVAVKYSASRRSLLLKLNTSDFRTRGVDLRFISAFPGEAEFLSPPLTYLRPKLPADGQLEQHVLATGEAFTVIEVEPSFG